MSRERTAGAALSQRIPSMDQIRGYAILGMLLVDYFEAYDVTWFQLHHHHEQYSYADTIAPLFLFVVGMGMRLSMKRRLEHVGVAEARKGMLKRYALLVLIAFTLYTGYLWDALMNIGLAGLIALWVVDKKPAVRVGVGIGFLALYQAVFSFTVYGDWLLRTVEFSDETMPVLWKIIPIGPELLGTAINGGPLGHWSWLLMLIAGTIGYDIIATKDTRKIVTTCLGLAVASLAMGWLLRMEWPGIKEFWPFSKYYMTAPVSFWSTGFCFLTLLIFHLICDRLDVRIPHLTVFGMNPLVIYILQWCIMESAERFIPEDITNWGIIFAGFAVFYGVCYGTAYFLYRKNIFVKL